MPRLRATGLFSRATEFLGDRDASLTIQISAIAMRKLKTGRSFDGEGTLFSVTRGTEDRF